VCSSDLIPLPETIWRLNTSALETFIGINKKCQGENLTDGKK